MTTYATAANLVKVAKAYASPDDWGVDNVYMGQLTDLANDLYAGDSVTGLIAHAEHVLRDCAEARCDLLIPHNIRSSSERFQADLKAMVMAPHGELTGVCLSRPCPQHDA